ncbi:ScbA/BarX family gamma-butyrolactone biosynthesis protein [Lentzea sp. NPDC051213]|uniref:ScbA/BarX family gamma-butyrolactone biosynthesis protein n=1 Tax=Lentzea sp. NPDC051213 TaxID=3364126 RepID=UPI0037942629
MLKPATAFMSDSRLLRTPQVAEFPAAVGETGQVLFDQTIPRHLVHRAAVSEVFLTDLRVTDETTFQVGAQWPRDHSFYRLRRTDRHDPMLLAETIRQAVLLIAHQVFEVPLDWKFVSLEKTWGVTPEGLEMDGRPANILLSMTCHDIKRTKRGVTGMRVEIGCYRDGVRIGGGELRWSCVSPATYSRLRGGKDTQVPAASALGVPVSGYLIGRERPRDVVLSAMPGGHTWQLRVDQTHPVLFDHPVDHVPGMVLMEAARQVAQLTVGEPDSLPVRCCFTFDRYVELDAPTVVTALPAPPAIRGNRGVRVVFDQDGSTVATSVLDMMVVC